MSHSSFCFAYMYALICYAWMLIYIHADVYLYRHGYAYTTMK